MFWLPPLLNFAASKISRSPQTLYSKALLALEKAVDARGLGTLAILIVGFLPALLLGSSVAFGQDNNTQSAESDNLAKVVEAEKSVESQPAHAPSQDADHLKQAIATAAIATEPAPSPADNKPDIKKHRIKAEAFKISYELEAVVDSPTYQVVNLRPKSFKELKLREAALHGQRVVRGQPLLQLDAEAFERSKRSAEQAVRSARLDLEQANKQADSMEESIRLDLEAAELAEKIAREDLEYFLRQGREQQVEQLKESLKSSEQYVEYAREEYEQLKKMYEADEITEETEEIVLKRAKNDLERSEYFLKNTRNRVERGLNVDLDRQESNMKNTVARAKLDLEQKRLGRDQRLESVQLQLARAEVALESANRELDLLEEDRPLLTQFAQLTGILFYGSVDRGQWKGSGNAEELLVSSGSLPSGRTLMTVVGTDKLFVHAKCPERWLLSISPGSTAFLELTASGGRRVEVECEELNQVPVEPGQYRANFRFVRQADATDLLPLLTGKLHGVLYEKENALLIPVEALHHDGPITFVKVYDEASGGQRRQNITIGQRDGKHVEVVQGLREGEYVVLP